MAYIGHVFVTGVLLGLALGFWLCYNYLCRPTQARYEGLVRVLVDMKKQGFVRQFEIEQAMAPDPSSEIRER